MNVQLGEAIPCLSAAFIPPAIIGPAELTTAALNGASLPALAHQVQHRNADPAARLFDISTLLQIAFRQDEALDLQRDALSVSTQFRLRRAQPAQIRLLAVMNSGSLMANTPLDFITNHLDVQLDLLFVQPDRPLPAVVPDHDIMFIAASEGDATMQRRLRHIYANWPRPVLNNPDLLPLLARERLAALLADLPGLCMPPTAALGRDEVATLAAGTAMQEVLPGGDFPVLIRPRGSHAGIGLRKVDDAAALAEYLALSDERAFYLTRYVDYRSADGLFRKYRVAFVDRDPFLCHMAASQHWMVHYLNAGMTECAAKRADEEAAMAGFEAEFAARHASTFAALHERLGFDYYSIDCGELPDGRLLMFEADTAAIIHMMDPVDMFPYKHKHMRKAFDAFGALLERRVGAPCRGQ